MEMTQNHTCIESRLKIDNVVDLNRNLSLKAHYENPRIK